MGFEAGSGDLMRSGSRGLFDSNRTEYTVLLLHGFTYRETIRPQSRLGRNDCAKTKTYNLCC